MSVTVLHAEEVSMDGPLIQMDLSSPVATLKLVRPASYNAINHEMLQLLDLHLDQIASQLPRVLIVSAAHPGFCSGVDLKESREATAEFAGRRSALMHRVLSKLRHLPLPTITAINGVAAGLGCELAISGDLRIASPESRFSYPEPKVAVPSPTHHLNALIGTARTQDMQLTARWVGADEAFSWGLVTRIAQRPDVAATSLANELLELSPVSLRETKKNLEISRTAGLEAATRHHIEQVAAAADTNDRAEALAAFAEKRTPKFTGT